MKSSYKPINLKNNRFPHTNSNYLPTPTFERNMDAISAAQILAGLKDATPAMEPALPPKKRGRPLTEEGKHKRAAKEQRETEKARKALLAEIKKTAKSRTKERRESEKARNALKKAARKAEKEQRETEKAREALLSELKKTAKGKTKKRIAFRKELKAMTTELGTSSSC